MKKYHILNGDALREQFPLKLEGEIIVARECLVDGNVSGDTLEDFFNNRATFLQESGGFDHYHEQSASEFQKIINAKEQAIFYLWFEDDLFCQVNLWFVTYLLNDSPFAHHAYLIRPPAHTPYGFGGSQLIEAFDQKKQLHLIDKLASCWTFYQKNNLDNLLHTATEIQDQLPFVLPAVEAHIDRIKLNRPQKAIIQIIKELETTDFAQVFRAFCAREPIYGFGDLQVKRLFDEVIAQKLHIKG